MNMAARQKSKRRGFFSSSWWLSAILHLSLLLSLAMLDFTHLAAVLPSFVVEFTPSESPVFLSSEVFVLKEHPEILEIPSPSEPESQWDVTGGLKSATSTVLQKADASIVSPTLAAERIEIPTWSTKAIIDGRMMMIAGPGEGISLANAFEGRSPEKKQVMLIQYGGSHESEAAVNLALQWLAIHQAQDGGWTFGHDQVCGGLCGDPGHLASSRNGATALALLPFLGAGETHFEGKYKNVVKRGIDFLLEHQLISPGKYPTGSWFEDGGTMYSHGLASIAICEAYAMTGDSRLRDPAQFGLNYLVSTQDSSGGGWRYAPGDRGDTSVVGWVVMAIKSGKIGQLEVPRGTLIGVNRFLDSVSSGYGATYGYLNPSIRLDGGHATTAIGVLCRMYQGLPKTHPQLIRGVQSICRAGPRLNNLYYTYYGSQVLHHWGGPEWDHWNSQMRDPLISFQVKQGHAAGSWPPNPFPEMGGPTGGRLYSTCMAAMILEVYYRHMPLYKEKALEDDFKL